MLVRLPAITVCLLAAGSLAQAQFQFSYTPETRTWTLSNGVLQAVLQLAPDDTFLVRQLGLVGGDTWRSAAAVPSSSLKFSLDTTAYDQQTRFTLVRHWVESVDRRGYRQNIVLDDVNNTVEVSLRFEMYEGQPVMRYGATLKNLGAQTVNVRAADLLPWNFQDEDSTFTMFRVNQWTLVPSPENFESAELALDPEGALEYVRSGAEGQQCSWLALRDAGGRGLIAGWPAGSSTGARTLRCGTSLRATWSSSARPS